METTPNNGMQETALRAAPDAGRYAHASQHDGGHVGVSLYVRLARDIPGIDPLQTDGKLLAKAIDTLDRASRKLSVWPLSDFYSVMDLPRFGGRVDCVASV